MCKCRGLFIRQMVKVPHSDPGWGSLNQLCFTLHHRTPNYTLPFAIPMLLAPILTWHSFPFKFFYDGDVKNIFIVNPFATVFQVVKRNIIKMNWILQSLMMTISNAKWNYSWVVVFLKSKPICIIKNHLYSCSELIRLPTMMC